MEEETQGEDHEAFQQALILFAGVALVVATFTIYNTLSILVAQRTRESASCGHSAHRGARCWARSPPRYWPWGLLASVGARHSACAAKVCATNQLKALIVGAPEELRVVKVV
jgi:hypothetical protein